MKALVTGAGGFLGRYIAEQLLARGDEVRGFSRGTYPELSELGVDQYQGDLQDLDAVSAACRGVDVVFHVAAVAGVWGPWKHYYGINTLGTQNVITACKRYGVPRLVYTSSPSVTFDGSDQCRVDESAPYPQKWLCHYPHTKALGEQQVLAANGDELRTCALRPHLIWGPRDEHLVPRLLQRARSGRLRRVGDGSNLVDMIHATNAAHAHLLAADRLVEGSPVCGRAYFLSQGEPVNCWQWIDEILARHDLPPVAKSISLKMAWRLGATLEFTYALMRRKSEPPMTRFVAAQLGTSHYFDITRAREDFGYEVLVSKKQGMNQF